MYINRICVTQSSGGYRQRTIENVRNTSATILVAKIVGPGEKLTAASAGQYGKPILQYKFGCTSLFEQIQEVNLVTGSTESINWAGNLQKDWNKVGLTREKLVNKLLPTFEQLFVLYPDIVMRSGGQSGIDIAAIIAAHKAGFEVHLHYPAKLLWRNAEGKDKYSSDKEILTLF